MTENIMNDKVRKIGKILEVLAPPAGARTFEIEDILYCPTDYKTGNDAPPIEAMRPFGKEQTWGERTDEHAWFRTHITVPDDFAGEGYRTELWVDTGYAGGGGGNVPNPQFILYINGKMQQGMDAFHRTAVLREKENDVVLYAYTGSKAYRVKMNLRLARVDVAMEELYYNVRVPYDALSALHYNTKEYMDIVEGIDRGLLLLDMREIPSERFSASVALANAYFRKEFYGKLCKKGEIATVGIGHTHIDCAWLWTLRQSREKVQRSFSSVLELMKRYPEYKFMSSQALLYKFLKEEAPEVYEEVKQRVKEGRWEVEGAMWVEADCNLSSGESLVRQVVYGRRFFRDEFGVDTRVLWLPDVFGYSAALPQILRKAGVEWFFTSKISWNECNTMPYDIFRWKGIDGTEIPTYFLTCQDKGASNDIPTRYATYVAMTRPSMVAGSWNRMQQKNLTNETLLTFGWGDGGGGPTPEMLEELRRESYGIPGIPTTKIEFAGDFLRRLEKRIKDNPACPVWRGELYLEFHRGTYTSQAKNKKNNRDSEFLFENAELLSETARVLCGKPYPNDALHEGWQTILTNQFHDIIPGSSIREVYEQCDIDYAKTRALGERLSDEARAALLAKIDANEGDYIVFNPNSFPLSGAVSLGGASAWVDEVPAKGYRVVAGGISECRVKIEGRRVETPYYRAVFDENYRLSSLYDKKNKRQVLSGKGNVLEIYEDFPYRYDAWELSYYHKEKVSEISDVESATVVRDGCRCGIRIVRRHMKSVLTQTVWFYDRSARIDFETEADWKETHQILKAAFPVDINSDKATYEIQFGAVERPTHENTSWDRMKFEVCAQKYADLSEGDYGVALLNNCKYGHDIHDGVMRLSLIKCADYPDPLADKCHHSFTYSLLPHKGCWQASDTVRESYALNVPLYAVDAVKGTGELPAEYSFLTVGAENVIAETVKRAEDSDDTVVRLYEAKNRKTTTFVRFGFDVDACYLCDLEENVIRALPVKDRRVSLTVKPFEIVTLKAVRAK